MPKSSLKNKVKSCKSLFVKIFEREIFIKALTTKHISLKYFLEIILDLKVIV